ncbi:hypothetical protein COW36_15005 [bacterium (Candidatus Blackallbacteria) CG17_big_fil_post_rev_8_21_14_2_50_48_46]|uniref:Diguanylate cyclase response regulator n=1 Tax=bacterium (Candidatus Blackallbacteria) CG17_big_fil_post_rev_8_21_14_2_50_48_46 TaxID=2014261 RepID=A0A2M7G2J2_9BACT|nr:MAG: hypothetical protein COW64_11545 [bacterium (Candidatus Blackallbacteria) CG18_big_fil_WC_8_21_14_2_50_49_26]PIW16018.1 MAG: hypothetical protein COW36_15005 [bacterium (Candidatus Blackallbacteria) CG17_big_fil_post_rev_8_21_14_2_50_48_46]PIW50430.1 MAG: hypothetical protein COW20_02720 [bacterium (Candidatus Blackallbacteria) CG13_big_fil_rev_8_21_14_2_50_49_14]
MPKVLAIDDEFHILQLVAEFLRDQDYEVTTANNGRLALECLQSYHPDIILCDVEMPEMNGYEVLEQFRKNSETAHIPFVFLTGMSARHQMRAGMNLGADDYLTKPFTFQELLKAVQSRLKKTEDLHQYVEKQLDAKEKIIQTLAYRDETTGLPNQQALEQAFWQITRQEQKLALIFFQLEGFQNSAAGHTPALGRALMKALTNRLRAYFHENQKNLFYLGINQFCLLLHIQNPQNLLQTFELIQQQTQSPFQIFKQEHRFGLSAGISLYPHNALNLENLLNSAQKACQQAEALGGNQCQFVL